VTVSENVLADHVQATFEHYKNVCARDDYKMAYGRERLEVERRHMIVVAERLKEFEAKQAVDRERTV
jgi:hypothetical protein